jgi:hypothetical protein
MSIRRSELPPDVLARIDAEAGPDLRRQANRAFSPAVLIDEGQSRARERMNKTEARYAQHLARLRAGGVILAFFFELFRLRLAHSTFYCPDFLVVRAERPVVQFHEVKGFMRDDAAVKVKTAAQLYPEFHFLVVRAAKGGRWTTTEVKRWQQRNEQAADGDRKDERPSRRKTSTSS